MGSSLNLSLTDELRSFINQNCGDGTCYSTPSEFVRDLLRQKKLQQETDVIRQGILEGYQDSINHRTTVFKGDLHRLLHHKLEEK